MATQTTFEHVLFHLIVIATSISQAYSVAISDNSTTNSQLIQPHDCVCLGENLFYECTVCGEGATVWTGSLFFCPGNEIVLRHSEYENASISGECNDGAVAAQSIKITDSQNGQCYSSQLDISMNAVKENKTIECLYVAGANETLINTNTIKFTTEPIPPPGDVYLDDISPTHLNFSWNPLPLNCPSITYIITSNDNCGRCPGNTTNTSAMCTDVTTNGQICRFYVQTEICGHIIGEKSNPLIIKLKVVDSPSIMISSALEVTNNNMDVFIANLYVSFNESSQFNITDGVDGSAMFYVVNYTAYLSGVNCGSAVIPSTSCEDGVCHHTFTAASSTLCSVSLVEGITVTAYAFNVLGKGPTSNPLSILVPQISGATFTYSSHEQVRFECIISVSIVSVTLFLVILAFFVTIVVVVMLFVKTKNRLSQGSVTGNVTVAAVYEEIQFTESPRPTTTEYAHNIPTTTENIAYSQVPNTTENIAYSQIPTTTENIAYSQALN